VLNAKKQLLTRRLFMQEKYPTDPMRRCHYINPINANGCEAAPMKNENFCYVHNPRIPEEEKQEARRKGGQNRRQPEPPPLIPPGLPYMKFESRAHILLVQEATMNFVLHGQMDIRVANSIGYFCMGALMTLDSTERAQRQARLDAERAANRSQDRAERKAGREERKAEREERKAEREAAALAKTEEKEKKEAEATAKAAEKAMKATEKAAAQAAESAKPKTPVFRDKHGRKVEGPLFKGITLSSYNPDAGSEYYETTPTGLKLVAITTNRPPLASDVTAEQWAAAIERGKEMLAEQKKAEAQKAQDSAAAIRPPEQEAKAVSANGRAG
jgi:hypothetical protein